MNLYTLRAKYQKQLQELELKIASVETRISKLKKFAVEAVDPLMKETQEKELKDEKSYLEELKQKRTLFKFYLDKIQLFLEIESKFKQGLIPASVYEAELKSLKQIFPDIQIETAPVVEPSALKLNFGLEDLGGE